MNQYFTNNENLKSNIHMIEVTLFDRKYHLYTDNGVFAKSGLDFGTKLLIETLPFDRIEGKVLDVGCGYGPIGIVIKSKTNADVDMIDVNLRAIHLAKMSASENKVDVNIFESDAFLNVVNSYDFITTNPPIRVGKKKVYEILIGAYDLLNNNGELWFVMRKDQGLKSAIKDIEKYYNIEVKAKKNGFFVLCCKKVS